MSEPRFKLTLTLTDCHTRERWDYAIGLDRELTIPPREVEFMKMGAEVGSMVVDALDLMRRREMRRGLFLEAARRLGAAMCDRLEDSEGWHGSRRIEPAKQALKDGRIE